ncbi:hypothetical protein MK805_06420 [Shimazuella sp. AN120528]|uniref:hypothetical protein n=1 Tax=Shimazuella soli TaxID=1892854 RepID=UPI001F10A279|nr:hypothetical protein [Shimazuella soli]MCH5584602.1 hypothetical protein [Shimazuella soli]
MKQTATYTVEVTAEFAFEWLLHGNFLLAGLDLQSFQFDELDEGGRFLAYEEINDHKFVPIKGKFLALKKPHQFQLEVYFPGGEQIVDYRIFEEERTSKIQVSYTNRYRSLMAGWWSKAFPKKSEALFSQALETEKTKLQESFHLNRLNTRISGVKIDQYEMEEKWKVFSPSNPYLRWVRPEV